MSVENYRIGIAAQDLPASIDWTGTAPDPRDACIAELAAALIVARGQLVTLGGDARQAHCDSIHRAVLDQIDVALAKR